MTAPPAALVLVRNTVSHDARVLREADTLRRIGYDVLVAGVVSVKETEQALQIDGNDVVRLAPTASIRRWLGSLSPRRAARGALPPSDRPPAASRDHPWPTPSAIGVEAGRGRLLAQRCRRAVVTAAYYLQGIRLVLHTSPSLVHANDYNTMWIGIAAKLLRRSSLVYDCHELWPDRNGRPEWRPWLLACEALFVRAADATVTTSPGYATTIARRYKIAPPIVVRNIPADPGRPPRRGDRGPGLAPVAVYVGGLMPGRGLEAAIRALAHVPEMRLRLIGPGSESYRATLLRSAERAGVADRLELLPAVPPATIVSSIADADLGLMLIEPMCRSYELTLPNKLFEYAAANLPILASDLPVIGPLVRDEQLGEAVPVDDVLLIAQGMRRLADPTVNAKLRDHVLAFAAQETWERERSVLERVYTVDAAPAHRAPPERRRITRVYGRYAQSARKQRSWSAANRGNVEIRRELVQAAYALAGDELRSARTILDAGCGTGWWLERLALDDRVSATLHGLELLPERVALAQRRVPSASIVAGDLRALPFADRAFGAAMLFTTLSSLAGADDVRRAITETRRVLEPGGALLIWEPRLPNPLNRSTLFVSASLVREALDGMVVSSRTTTVLPPVARRLGRRTERLYPALARVRWLRTHRLLCALEPADPGRPTSTV